MIFRYHTLCPGCSAKIILRLSIGIDSYQPFYYVCERCGAANKGSLEIDYSILPYGTKITLDGQNHPMETDFENPDQIITIGLDLPCILTGADSPESQFPFLHQSTLMGSTDKLIQFQNRISSFRSIVNSDWPKLKRLLTYYTNRDWIQFDREWENIFEDTSPLPKNDFERHDRLHRALEMLFISLLPELDYLILKKELNYLISGLPEDKLLKLKKFSIDLTKDKELLYFQRSLFERLAFMVENFSAISSGFPALFYNANGKKDLKNLRIMRDDFEILKAHYLSSYEICHKVIKIIIGIQNIHFRGDPDLFDGGKPTSLTKFDRIPNALKINYINQNIYPEFHSRWTISLNKKLRNAIGHNSIYHDLKSGMLIFDDGDPIPYSKFVSDVLNLLPLLLYCIQVIKMMYILQYFKNQAKSS
jgi:hypothetical protein